MLYSFCHNILLRLSLEDQSSHVLPKGISERQKPPTQPAQVHNRREISEIQPTGRKAKYPRFDFIYFIHIYHTLYIFYTFHGKKDQFMATNIKRHCSAAKLCIIKNNPIFMPKEYAPFVLNVRVVCALFLGYEYFCAKKHECWLNLTCTIESFIGWVSGKLYFFGNW